MNTADERRGRSKVHRQSSPDNVAVRCGNSCIQVCSVRYFFVSTPNKTFPPPLGIYVTLGLFDRDWTIALLASIFLNATNASPAFSSDLEIVAAASASPSARITAACRSCSAWNYVNTWNFMLRDGRTLSTMNLARSASVTVPQ
jgi:hypothetical protein